MKNKTIIYIGAALMLLTACQDSETLTEGEGTTVGNVIRIGGINTDELVATAAVTRTDPAPVDEENVQRTDAENISWLVGPLKAGLDITYGKASDRANTSRVAILKLLTDTNGNIKYTDDGSDRYAEYSFLYRNDTNGEPTADPAVWYDNGSHFFEGLHIPNRIQYDGSSKTVSAVYDATSGTAKNLTLDQHDDAPFVNAESEMGNYTLLSHYLGMPSNFTLNATVARVKLPFRHRLARVLAYILIDPEMGSGIKLEGYTYKEVKDGETTTITPEDPTSTKIRFCNVNVLAGVKDSYNATTKHHTYTPQWTEARKVVPHFVGERGSYDDSKNQILENETDNFIAYYDTQKKEYVYPTDALWKTLHGKTYDPTTNETSDGAYKRTIYGKVPVYDLIVRPTYTQLNRVMYDEEGYDNATTRQNLYVLTNQIDFEITLSNGLQYEKRFTFDLDANYQTVVYLHISRERVDYNSSGSDLWVENIGYDDWYGVNNQNGNTLSFAGSSWQRAYTYGTTPTGTEHPSPFDDVVTDGHFYTNDSEDEKAQYVTQSKWIEMLREACVGGKHHGDYFILHDDISIPAAAFPANFVFTGHLDGLDHTITLTDASYTPAHDEYETWTQGGGTKYVEVSSGNYAVFTPDPSATYCDNSENYNVIADISNYSGSTAYIRTVASTTYQIVPVGSSYNDGPYYKYGNDTYVEIDYMSTYLAAFHIYSYDGSTYTEITDKSTLASSGTTYYEKTGEDVYEAITDINAYIGIYRQVITYKYELITFYKFVHYEPVIGSSTGATDFYMFSGLNGKYSTAQESDASATWEANVHKEKIGNTVYWVPYKSATDGWRAEIINTNVNGGTLFPSSVYNTETKQYTDAVTGYVHNCWEGSTYNSSTHKWTINEGGRKVPDYTPSLPEY